MPAEVALEEVAAYLNLPHAGTVEKPAENHVKNIPATPLDLPEETLRYLQQQAPPTRTVRTAEELEQGQGAPPPDAAQEEPEPRIETPQNLPVQQVSSAPVPVWHIDHPVAGTVRVTTGERDLYYKAAIFDKDVELDIGLLKGACTVRMRTVNAFEMKVMDAALVQEYVEGMDEQLLTGRRLEYRNVLQVVAIEQRPADHHISFNGPNFPEVADAVTILRSKHEQMYRAMNVARHNLMINAVRTFELKMKICADAMANGDFFMTADIG